MKCNVGGFDRFARIILGILLLAVGVYFHSWVGVIGLVPLLTGAASRCLLYLPFRLSTCRTEPVRVVR